MDNIFRDSLEATREAFKQTRTNFGIETDPDLRLYKRLKEQDFDSLSQQYGRDPVVDYIRTMESKLIQRR